MSHFMSKDFSKAVNKALAAKGIRIIGSQPIPDMTSDLPYANAERGYVVNDNGCGRVWSYQEVIANAK